MKNSIADIISRRALLQGLGIGAAAGMISSHAATAGLSIAPPVAATSTLTFTEISHGINQNQLVAANYTANVLLRWGDKVFADSPAFDADGQTAAAQDKQFGYNCHFTAFMPLPMFSGTSDHGLLCVNHESTQTALMFPDDTGKKARMNPKELAEYEANKIAVSMAAHGHSVVEVKKADDKWQVVEGGKYNRRINAQTKMKISGPAAGNERLQTTANPAGNEVWGTIATSHGGVTPWGTVLLAEENIHHYFGGKAPPSELQNYTRNELGSATNTNGWDNTVSRFHMDREPREPNRFGWIVEFNPYDPTSQPVKRTALGRFKHAGAAPYVNKDGRVVVFMGDAGAFEYIYRFVTKNKIDYKDSAANMNLLDEGTLSAAQFNKDGTLTWLPLVHGTGPLTAENGFKSQADVVIEARRAAQLAGATPMDKPADVRANPVTGIVFALLNSNPARGFQDKNVVNPRMYNLAGHILELAALTGDHADDTYGWDFFILAGDPLGKNSKTIYGSPMTRDGWLACPSSCTFDKKGRIWIATDQGQSLQRAFQTGDGLYAADTSGPAAAATKYFYRAPVGAELCSPCFTPDNKTLFVAVQHPGDGSDFKSPFTRWPDFNDKIPPRPSIVAITKDDGGEIGS